MQQSFWTPAVQITIAFCALCIAVSSVSFTVLTWRQNRNAQLVAIGVGVLRADPKKEPSAASAREWALNLIDDNSGGVKFSPQARTDLLNEALTAKLPSFGSSDIYSYDTYEPYKPSTDRDKQKPAN
jgi:hypothetical protein